MHVIEITCGIETIIVSAMNRYYCDVTVVSGGDKRPGVSFTATILQSMRLYQQKDRGELVDAND